MPVALAALPLALARAADPAPPAVVAWEVAEGCPEVEALHEGIRRSLGGLELEPTRPVEVGVVVTREAPQRFRLELRLDAGDGPTERVLAVDSCAAAIDTAAWLIAIAIDIRAVDPSAPATIPEPPPSPVPPAEPPPRPAPPAESAPAEPAPEPAPVAPLDGPPPKRAKSPAPVRALHLDLWAGGGVGLGVLPRAAPAAALGLTLAGRRWEAELSGHYWALQRAEFGGGRGGRFVHGHAAARGCGAWERGPVRVPVCGGLALGGVTGEGTGELTPRTARSLSVGLLAGAGVRLRLHPRVGLLARAEAVFGVRRPGFALEPAPGVVFRPAAVGFSALLALAIRLR